MEKLKTFPLSTRIIREIHKILLSGTRGYQSQPGEFRNLQNFIGTPGASLNEAVFIPPAPEFVINCMGDMEKYFYSSDTIPPLIKVALIHAQFETIHPFMDGNGRIGRLLITFYLFWEKILEHPILYMSYYLKKNRTLYYDHLMNIRTHGAWEKWIAFFLNGIIETSNEGVSTAREIIGLRDRCIVKLRENRSLSSNIFKLIDELFHSPFMNANLVAEKLQVSFPAAYNFINQLEKIGILKEITGQKRYRYYIFTEYFDILKTGTEY